MSRSYTISNGEPGASSSSQSAYVTLVSSDGFEFHVRRSAACISGTIRRMLDPSSMSKALLRSSRSLSLTMNQQATLAKLPPVFAISKKSTVWCSRRWSSISTTARSIETARVCRTWTFLLSCAWSCCSRRITWTPEVELWTQKE
jgi:Skp1 family, tetramerisation domain